MTRTVFVLAGLACTTRPTVVEDRREATTAPSGVLQRLARDVVDGREASHRTVIASPGVPLPGADVGARARAALRDLPLPLSDRMRSSFELQRVHALRDGGGIAVFGARVDGLAVREGGVRILVDGRGRLRAWNADDAVWNGLGEGLKEVGFPLDRPGAEALAAAVHGPITAPQRSTQVVLGDAGRLRRAWEVEQWVGQPHSTDATLWRVTVDAVDGQVHSAVLLTVDGWQYRVYADPVSPSAPNDGPLADVSPHPTEVPDGVLPAFSSSFLVAQDGFLIHPDGLVDPWLADDAVVSSGLRADVYVDHYAPDGLSDGDFRATVTAPLAFDYPYDPTLSPTDSESQAAAGIVAAFYTVHWLGDWWYESGFDEVAGNAQADNFGRGGLDGDAMLVEVQDGAFDGFRNNAWMSTPADGLPPKMAVYLWSAPTVETVEVVPGGPVFEAGIAEFGPSTFLVEGSLVDAGSDPLACTVVDGDVTGRVVLVDRGDCTFQGKAALVEEAGGMGVVLVDNVAESSPPDMGGTLEDAPVSIPVLSVTSVDGAALRAEMALGDVDVRLTRTGVEVEGALDHGVLAHEWGHYLFGRLLSCGSPQCGAMNEGHADFTALHLMLREGDDLDGLYAVGVYASSGLSDQAAYYGIRRVPYTRDRGLNALTFRHIALDADLPDEVHPMALNGAPNTEVHNAGEVWASTMWDAMAALQDAGPAAGRTFQEVQRRVGDVVVAGFTLAPSDSTWLDTRDALLVGAAVEDPADAVVLATAFAGRGMGTCAVGPEPMSTDFAGIVEDFTLRSRLEVTEPTFTSGDNACDDDAVLDGGEDGWLHTVVTNMGPVDLVGATLQWSVSPAVPALQWPDGDAVGLPDLPAFTAVAVDVAVRLDRATAAWGGAAVTATASHADACTPSVSASTYLPVEADVASGVASVDGFDVDDGSWLTGGAGGEEIWGRVVALDGSAVWHGVDVSGVTDTWLQTPSLPVDVGASLVVSLLHRYRFEADPSTWWDGGVMELSVDGGEWTDVSAWADPGYDGVITAVAANPLAGRSAFSGASAAWPSLESLVLDLGDELGGHEVGLRFRSGTDLSVGDFGWEIDEVAVSGLASAPFPAPVADAVDCNADPVAVAGMDQTVWAGELVTLDGSASWDPLDEPLTFQWAVVGGPEPALVGADMPFPTFVAPEVWVAEAITLALTVSDGDASAVDEVTVLVEPPPVPPDTAVPPDTGEPATGGTGAVGGTGGTGGVGTPAEPGVDPPGRTTPDPACGCASSTSGAPGLGWAFGMILWARRFSRRLGRRSGGPAVRGRREKRRASILSGRFAIRWLQSRR